MRPKSHKNINPHTKIDVYVYIIENSISEKKYIGITYHPLEVRWKQHLYEAFGLRKHRHLLCAIRKYGAESFKISLLETAKTWKEACRLEKFYIKRFGTFHKDGNGYNMTLGGDGVIGYQQTAEQIARTVAGIRKLALERNELLRPAVEKLMNSGFVNFSEFATRLNEAGMPTLTGDGKWGLIKVKNLLRTLGYDMKELDAMAVLDKKNLRHIKATIEKSKSFYRSIRPAVKRIMVEKPDSLRKVRKELDNRHVPSPSGKNWHKITTKKMLNHFGYNVEELIKSGQRKVNKPREVVVAGVLYASLNKATKVTGNKHISRDIKHGREGYYYLKEGQRQKPPRKKRRPPTKVFIEGKIYEHSAAAARELGFKPDTITNRCNSPNFPDHFFCDEYGNRIE